jgi:Transglutaminase-like superfamily
MLMMRFFVVFSLSLCIFYSQPTRLNSPDTVLKTRKGNSFEIATLLCSILIGFGFPAMVVCGYATREVTTNDQRRVKCPYIPEEKSEAENVEEPDPKYRLKDIPFLKSRFLMQVQKKKLDGENAILQEIERQEQLKIEEFERPPPDPQNGYRIHAWIVMIKDVPWCYKAEFKRTSACDDEDDDASDPMAFFIEPSTGFRHEVTDACYQGNIIALI